MATQKTDVVIVGVGGTGGILAAELGKAGMKVIGLERGPRHVTSAPRRCAGSPPWASVQVGGVLPTIAIQRPVTY